MSVQLEMPLGDLDRPPTPRERALELLRGRAALPFHEAVALAYADVQRRKAANDWPPGGAS